MSDGDDRRDAPRDADNVQAHVTAWVEGRVQGVGFRFWVRALAVERGLRGWASNLPDGRVEVVAEGPRSSCEQLLSALRGPDTPGHVTRVADQWSSPREDVADFTAG